MRSGPGCDGLAEDGELRPLRQPPRRRPGGQLSLRQQQRRRVIIKLLKDHFPQAEKKTQ